jgi:hypothetical protein
MIEQQKYLRASGFQLEVSKSFLASPRYRITAVSFGSFCSISDINFPIPFNF